MIELPWLLRNVLKVLVTGRSRVSECCQRISAWIGGREGWRVLGITESPITGAAGNREFLIAAVLA